MIPSSKIKKLTFKDFLSIVWKRIWIVVIFVAIIGGSVAIKDLSSSKIYMAQAIVRIEVGPGRNFEEVDEINSILEEKTGATKSELIAKNIATQLGLLKEGTAVGDLEKNSKIIKNIRSAVDIKLGDKTGYVNISVFGKDSWWVASVANAWAKEFIQEDNNGKEEVIWAKSQLGEALNKLEEAESALANFLQESSMVMVPEAGLAREKAIEILESQRIKLEAEINRMPDIYGEEERGLEALRDKLAVIEEQTKKESGKLSLLQEKTIEYEFLNEDVERSKLLCDNLLKRIEKLSAAGKEKVVRVGIVRRANVPLIPIKPKPAKTIPIAVAVGIVLGVICCFVLEQKDTAFKSCEDIKMYTGLSCVGAIPFVKKEEHNLEAIKDVKTALVGTLKQDSREKTILVTSCVAKEGKSIFASNLAISFAKEGKSTLLIDADMRGGEIAQSFGLDAKVGLTDILAGLCIFEKSLVSTPISNLTLIPAGSYVPNLSELLQPDKIDKIFEEARNKFQYIVVDSPSLLNVADAVIFGHNCNRIVLVVRAHHTLLNHVTEAKKILSKQINVLKVVLNTA